MTPRLHLHRASRADSLAAVLATAIRAPLLDPLAPHTVVVASRGMERWLRHRLAAELGICSNVRFPFPGQGLAAVFGTADEPVRRWSADGLVWPIIEALPGFADDPEFALIHRWLATNPEARAASAAAAGPGGLTAPVRRSTWALAREIAEVLDRVALTRPAWTDAWEAGREPELDAALPPSSRPPVWQGRLWRALRAAIPTPPATWILRQREPMAGDPIHIFGVSSMPPTWVEAWGRAAKVRDIHVYQLAPARDEDREPSPLAAALGRLGRDHVAAIRAQQPVEHSVPDGFPDAAPATSALAILVDDLVHARSRAELLALRPGRTLGRDDPSVQVHACHGPIRQVEALREALLERFDADPTLEPRHVVVMTPTIGRFAPLVRAVFDQRGPGSPRLPTHIADLGVRVLNPLADLGFRLLALVEGRLTATDLADLVALDPVRLRFAWTEDEVRTLRGWIDDAGFRWAADEAERVTAGLPAQTIHTLEWVLDRLALGVTSPDDGHEWESIAPYEAMDESPSLFGRFAECCARLLHWRRALSHPRTMAAWSVALVQAVDELGQVPPEARFLRSELGEGLEELAELASPTLEVDVGVLGPALEGRFDLRHAGDRPATGAITVSALTPMRSVPFRVVCLLGMDDGLFPRTPVGRGFDALAGEAPGGPRQEDRNLLLESILAAREQLLVFHTGADGRTGRAVAPAVPIGDLLDVIDETFSPPAGVARPRDLVIRQHSVQPFSASGFAGPPRPRRYDRRMWAAAMARRSAGPTPPLFPPDATLPPPPALAQLDVDDLIQWLRRPVRRFFRRRLHINLDRQVGPLRDRDEVELDALQRWGLDAGVVDLWDQGVRSRERAAERLVRRGALPVGAPGIAELTRSWAKLDEVVELAGDRGESHDRRLFLPTPGQPTLIGRVRVHDDTLVDFAIDDPGKPKRLLTAWIRLLALRAAGVEIAAARLYGIQRGRATMIELGPPDDPWPVLTGLVELFDAARRAPIPLLEKCSHAYAMGWLKPGRNTPEVAANNGANGQWENYYGGGEGLDATLGLVYPIAPFELPALAPEFHRLALAVWAPIVAARSSNS